MAAFQCHTAVDDDIQPCHMVIPKLAQVAQLLCWEHEAGDRQRSCWILSRLPMFGFRLQSVHHSTHCASAVKENSRLDSELKS